ncbi:hypothetical protein SAMN02745132_04631, partial [Enterovibrio nigricans DSM 22720]
MSTIQQSIVGYRNTRLKLNVGYGGTGSQPGPLRGNSMKLTSKSKVAGCTF